MLESKKRTRLEYIPQFTEVVYKNILQNSEVVGLYGYLPIFFCVCPSVCLPVCLSVYPSVRLSDRIAALLLKLVTSSQHPA